MIFPLCLPISKMTTNLDHLHCQISPRPNRGMALRPPLATGSTVRTRRLESRETDISLSNGQSAAALFSQLYNAIGSLASHNIWLVEPHKLPWNMSSTEGADHEVEMVRLRASVRFAANWPASSIAIPICKGDSKTKAMHEARRA